LLAQKHFKGDERSSAHVTDLVLYEIFFMLLLISYRYSSCSSSCCFCR